MAGEARPGVSAYTIGCIDQAVIDSHVFCAESVGHNGRKNADDSAIAQTDQGNRDQKGQRGTDQGHGGHHQRCQDENNHDSIVAAELIGNPSPDNPARRIAYSQQTDETLQA